MEIRKTLKVSAAEFFGAVAGSAAKEISQAQGKRITADRLCTGYSFKKEMKNSLGMTGEARITITAFEKDREYGSVVRSGRDSYRISYQIEELGREEIAVTYREEVQSGERLRALNWQLMSWLMKPFAARRMDRTLAAMEGYIFRSRTAAGQPIEGQRPNMPLDPGGRDVDF